MDGVGVAARLLLGAVRPEAEGASTEELVDRGSSVSFTGAFATGTEFLLLNCPPRGGRFLFGGMLRLALLTVRHWPRFFILRIQPRVHQRRM